MIFGNNPRDGVDISVQQCPDILPNAAPSKEGRNAHSDIEIRTFLYFTKKKAISKNERIWIKKNGIYNMVGKLWKRMIILVID